MKNTTLIVTALLIAIVLVSCTPAAATQPTDVASPIVSTSTPDILPSATPSPIPSPTSTPAPVFPVSRFESIPQLNPITVENAGNLTRVASFESASIEKVFLNDAQDKIIVQTHAGIETINTADFTAEPFSPLPISPFGQKKVSANGKFAVSILPGASFIWDIEIVVTDIEKNKTVCSFLPGAYGGGNGVELNFHENPNLLLLTGSLRNGYNVIVWDLKSCAKKFEAISDSPVYAVSNDVQYAAIAEKGQLYLRKINGGPKMPIGDAKDLRGAFFLPDDKSILITNRTGNAVFDISSGEKVLDLPGNMGNYFASYRLSESGKWVIVSAYDQNRAFNIDEKKIYTLPTVTWYTPIPGSDLLRYEDYIWNIEQQIKVGNLQKYGHNYGHGFVFSGKLLISADGNYAAINSDEEPFNTDVLDLSTRKLLYTIAGYHDPIRLPGTDGFIVTSKGKTGFFTFSSNQPLKVIDLDYVDGAALENGSIIVWDSFGKLSLIDSGSQSVANTAQLPFIAPQAPIQHLAPAWEKGSAFSFDGFLSSFISNPVAVSHNRTVGVRQPQKDTVQFFKVQETNLARGYIADEDILLTTTAPGLLYSLKFSPSDRLVAGVFPTKILIWDGVTGEKIQSLPLSSAPYPIYAIDFSPDESKLLVSHGSDVNLSDSIHTSASLRVFDIQSGRLVQNYKLEQQYKKTGCNITLPFVVTQDGTQVISITQNCKIGIFDINTLELKKEFGKPYSNANIDFALSPDNQLLAVAYKDILELWNVTTGTLVRQYANPAYAIYAPYREEDWRYITNVAFSPDGQFIGTHFSGLHYSIHSTTTLWGAP
jgi:WD40 repeat protein